MNVNQSHFFSVTATVLFSITDVQPSSGSLVGGTVVELTGTGLSEYATVQFGGIDCQFESVNVDGTSMTCITGSSGATHLVVNDGSNPGKNKMHCIVKFY